MKKILSSIIILAVIILGYFLTMDRGNKVELNSDNNQANSQSEQDAGNNLKVGTRVGDLAPDFEVVDYQGNTVKLSDFKGSKPVFVNFWASWCPFCLDEMLLMGRIQEQFGDAYVTIAINRNEGLKTAKQYTDDLGVTNKYIVAWDDGDDIYKRYNGFSMPYSIFIDKDGIIKSLKLGPLAEEELVERIGEIIN
ncbi:MAG: hypothetical protein COV29_01710 [Candidatus Yanofskybacteria bacterium CG10_big_fil_rev_8_21_14_0_10_36_16]|uniref:Thioredoxin domain-containing protein n=1 Tax=Candidatus Yanofskybacteria bacterium CG10_big_fil_rev_8_21_14_0_10_36_16 TaxID=1975096 RepID=A0A2J0Q7C7_9BACT|nr:MAG: hypothetical protein COV29_01710 [Candidatus Yanofskybacteria bacterium CG10_big_fil_rev_8_21_14_0_10_36_16]